MNQQEDIEGSQREEDGGERERMMKRCQKRARTQHR